jgi:hypothetical protein
LHYLDAEGERLLVPGFNDPLVLVSPSGEWVAYRKDDESNGARGDVIAIVPTAGGEGRELVATGELLYPDGFEVPFPEPNLRLLSLIEWSPTADVLFLTTFVAPAPGTESTEPPVMLDDLWAIDVESAEATEILAPGDGGQFVLSPDGLKIAVTQSGWDGDGDALLAVSNSDGSDRRELLRFPRAGQDPEAKMYARPQWSMDGSNLVLATFQQETGIEDFDSSALDLQRVSLDGTVELLGSVPSEALLFKGPTYFLHVSPGAQMLATVLEQPPPTPSGESGDQAPTPDTRSESLRLLVDSLDAASDWTAVGSYDVASRLTLGDWSPDGERFVYAARRISEDPFTVDRGFFVGRAGHPPLRLVDEDRVMRVSWLGPDHVVMLLSDETPILVLASVDGDLEMIARLDEAAGGERQAYALAVSHPSADPSE